ncbi:MAG TPA: Rrf2 family transcriptional regulator [Anaerolineae bacterium]|nr:Rrf2 family transcriptional regulator [Anaerolineae bacterium]
MEITRQSDYAVRAVLDLAMLSDDERAFSEAIAGRQDIPTAFLTKIFSRLSAEGIVTTRRGVKGGVHLARPASEITMLEVIEAIDGPIALNRCTRRPSDCSLDATCAVYPIWRTLCDELRARLNSITFEMLAASAQSKRAEAASAVLRNLANPT